MKDVQSNGELDEDELEEAVGGLFLPAYTAGLISLV